LGLHPVLYQTVVFGCVPGAGRRVNLVKKNDATPLSPMVSFIGKKWEAPKKPVVVDVISSRWKFLVKKMPNKVITFFSNTKIMNKFVSPFNWHFTKSF